MHMFLFGLFRLNGGKQAGERGNDLDGIGDSDLSRSTQMAPQANRLTGGVPYTDLSRSTDGLGKADRRGRWQSPRRYSPSKCARALA